MKDSFYFPHDFHARHDPKLERLRMEVGPVGDGIYWDIVEMLYEEGGFLLIQDIPLFAKSLNTTEDLLKKVIFSSNLFLKNDLQFYSESVLTRLKLINAKRRKARTSAKLSHSANAERTQSERSARKKGKKVKESKVNKVISDMEIPPKKEDLIAYCQERKNEVDVDRWFDHYASKGWLIGKTPMVDWKAAIRTWEKEKKQEQSKYKSL